MAAVGSDNLASNAREQSWRDSPRAAITRQALAELIAAGPSTETPRMVGELLAADKRISSFIAFVPVLGPWLIQRSAAHSPTQKFWLTWLSLTFSVLIALGIVSRLPTPETEVAKLHSRIESEIKALGDFANHHRATYRSYPDKATWKRYVERNDPRFFDPWARPYVYEPSASGITISTLGRDGSVGGTEEDADETARF